jgi:quinoprotein glucose dehydrogenase
MTRRLALLLLSVPAAGADVQTFAVEKLAGQPLAIAVDDAGRVYLSCTGRAFGRGVPDISGDGKLLREDAAVFTLEDRSRLLRRWREEGAWKAVAPEAMESAVCLTDRDGDGQADERVVVAGDFRDALDGPAGGILPLSGGGVLFACTPTLWRLEDDNGDLRADRRLPLLTGFGIRTGSGWPGLCTLTEGPDGRIYFASGRRGCRVVSAEGERFETEGSGAVFRCRPDGSELEMLATGLNEAAGIAVDLRGQVFVADTEPENGATRVLHVLPGADFSAPGLSPLLTLPCLATGFILSPSAGAGSVLPEFLLADGRNGGALIPLTFTPSGTGMTLTAGSPLWQGAAACGLAAAPDGSVLWSEWDQGLTATATTRILRLLPGDDSEVRRESALLLANKITSLPADRWPALLEHTHPLVRQRAREALTKLGYQEALDFFARTAKRSPSLASRLNAVWGLAALGRTTPMLLNEVLLLFSSSEPDIRALAVRIIGESGGAASAAEIVPLLRDPAPEVRVEAALALARIQPRGITSELSAELHKCADSDAALRHALTLALSRCAGPAEIVARGRETDSLWLKVAAVAALRMTRAAETADFLADDHPAIVHAAARAVYDARILPGFPALAAALAGCEGQPALVESEFVRRALAAAFRTGSPEAAAAVAAFAALPDSTVPPALQTAAVETLKSWDEPPAYEPVHGRFDPPLPRPLGLTRAHLEKLNPDTGGSKPAADPFVAAFENTKLTAARRADALEQLAAIQPAKALELARALLPDHGAPELRAAARTLIMRLDSGASYTQLSSALSIGSTREMQATLTLAQRFDSKSSDAFWMDLGKKFLENKVEPEVRLEVWEGLQLRDVAPRGPIRRILETADAALDEAADPLARWRMCQTGGDPDKGRLVFETSRTLQCTACHSLQGRGGVSGPELDGVASRLSRDKLLASLVQPSALIAPGFGMATLTLEDGTELTGVLRRRDDQYLLLATPRGPRRIAAKHVRSVSAPISPMPSASALLTPREIRDLMAWLETLK